MAKKTSHPRRSQEVSFRAGICHEVPVAVTRRGSRKGILTHQDEATKSVKASRTRPKREKSVIETAREFQDALNIIPGGVNSDKLNG